MSYWCIAEIDTPLINDTKSDGRTEELIDMLPVRLYETADKAKAAIEGEARDLYFEDGQEFPDWQDARVNGRPAYVLYIDKDAGHFFVTWEMLP